MFTPEERDRLRDGLVAAARADERVTGAALTGSGALGKEDAWSDIDLALAVSARAENERIVADWTARMYREHGAVHHVDMPWGEVLFRVFLLANTLQVDIAFWPEGRFGAIGPTFRLLFGSAQERSALPEPAADGLIGMGWLYALHARSSIARGKPWQAEHMISGVRDQALALACLRHGLPTAHGKGIDGLPPEVLAGMDGTLVRSLELPELKRAFGAVVEFLAGELERGDAALAGRLAAPLRELAR